MISWLKKISILVMSLVLLFSGSYAFAADNVRQTDVSKPSSNCVLLKVNGTFSDGYALLKRINEIRKEACNDGNVPDPRNTSRFLKASDYVPMKWSSSLEWIAQTRAAEASIRLEHIRPNGKRATECDYNDRVVPCNDNLAWSGESIENNLEKYLYQAEKSAWVTQDEDEDYSHYINMINPEIKYVGIAGFQLEDNWLNVLAVDYSKASGLNEEHNGISGDYSQIVEVTTGSGTVIKKLSLSGKTDIGVGSTAKLTCYASIPSNNWYDIDAKCAITSGLTWSSSDTSVAKVSSSGKVSMVSKGSAKITAKAGKFSTSCTVTSKGVPAKVTGLNALSFDKRIRINWDKIGDVDGYEIYAMYSDGSKYKTYSTTKNYCYFTNLTNNSEYSFKVRAYNGGGSSKKYGSYSSVVSATPSADSVKNLKAASYDQRIKLTWDSVDSADGYYIYAMYSDGSKYKTYKTEKTSCNFNNLVNGKKYQFKIRVYKLDSNGVRGYGDYCKAVSATPRMDAVDGLKALAFNKKVRIDWSASEKADGYYINVVYSDGSKYKNYSTVKTYCNFTDLSNNTTYKFRVRAYTVNSKGSKVYGKYCSYKSATPYNDTVNNLRAEGMTNKIRLSWDTVDKADGYNIYAMFSDGSKYKTYNTSKTSCNFNNLKSGKTYKFKIREYKLDGKGIKVYGTYGKTVKATAK